MSEELGQLTQLTDSWKGGVLRLDEIAWNEETRPSQMLHKVLDFYLDFRAVSSAKTVDQTSEPSLGEQWKSTLSNTGKHAVGAVALFGLDVLEKLATPIEARIKSDG